MDDELQLIQGFVTPGYILHQPQALASKGFFIRNIVFTESFFVRLSKTLIQKAGRHGKELLYTAGKQYGYRFAVLNRYPKGNANKVTVLPLWDFLRKLAHMEEIITYRVNIQHKVMELEIGDLVVASKSGLWYSPVSAGGGMWCYLAGDYSLECSAKKIAKGRHLIMLGPRETLVDSGFEVIKSDKLPTNINILEYVSHNKPIVKSVNHSSLSQLLKDGEIKNKKGSMYLSGSNDRIFLLEISRLYGLEQLIEEIFVYGASYECFYDIGVSTKASGDPYESLSRILTAFGFGIVEIIKNNDVISIIFNGYPWFPPKPENTSFAYIKGAVLGFLESSSTKKYDIKSVSASTLNNVFTVSMELEIK